MKRMKLIISLALMAVLLAACTKNAKKDNTTDVVSPTPSPVVTAPAQGTNDQNQGDNKNTEDNKKVQDYYSFDPDMEYVYEGKGNEYAAFQSYVDYISKDQTRIQTRMNNGGTETVRVIEAKDGKLSVVYKISECYYREDFLQKQAPEGKAEVLLMEPLKQGTEWKLPDGRKRYISGVDEEVKTPSGTYQAIEVTTEGEDGTTKDYYAKKVGLVKTVYSSGDAEVSSTLSEINKDTPFTQTMDVYYPDTDESIYPEPVELTFHTNDITRQIIQETVKKNLSKDSRLPIITTNTTINSLYLGDDGIVYVDFSPEMVSEMNLGSGYETLVLQSITNTLGNYYGVQEVYITINGKPYESGHVLMKKGETFKVNMDQVVTE